MNHTLLGTKALQDAIFNSENFSSIATDAKGVIQIFNIGAEKMLGYAAAEVVNRVSPAELSDPHELVARAQALSTEVGTTVAPGFQALVYKAARGIEDIYELTQIRKDGSTFPAIVSVTALRDAQSIIIGYLLIGTDNTARKRAEEELLKAGALQRAIFNSAIFSSIATDANGVIQIFNVGAEHMLGYTAAEVVNKITPAELSDPQELVERAKALSIKFGVQIAPGFEALVYRAARGIEDIYELTKIRKDGSRFPAVVSVTALRDEKLNIIGYLLIGTDNTARKRAEEELLKAGALQRAIFNSANFSSIATDAKGVIQIFNVGAERMLGYTAAEVVNKISPAEISDSHELVERAKALSVEFATTITAGFQALVYKAARGIEDIYELTKIRKDGSTFPAIVSVTALRDAHNVIIGYLLIATDNTARKKAEEELIKAGALQRAIFNSANFSSIATDAKGVIQIFNVGAERMLGYTAAEVVNKFTPAEISDPDELVERARALSLEFGVEIKPGFEALAYRAARGIEDIYEITRILKNGSRLQVVSSVTALRDVEETIIGYLLIGTDNTARKKAEVALHASEIMAEAIIASAMDAIVSIDANFRVFVFNAAAENMFGVKASEIKGKPLDRLIPERLRKIHNTHIHNFSESGITKRTMAQLGKVAGLRANGDEFPIEASISQIDIDGEKKFTVVIRDISERIKMEGELAKTQARFQAFFDLNLIGMAITSPEKGMVTVNDKICQILGYERDELLNLRWSEITHPDDLAADVAQFDRLARNEIDYYALEKRFIRKDGAIVFANIAIMCVRLPDASMDYLLGLVEDISDRKAADLLRREVAERFSQVVENIEEAFWLIEMDTNLAVYLSPGYAKIWGRPLSSLYDSLQAWSETLHPDDRERVLEARKTQALGGYRIEYRIIRPDGEVRWIHDRAFPVKNDAGKIYRIAGIIDDITVRKELENLQRKAAERFRQVVENIDEVFWLMNIEQDHMIYLSPGYEKIWGRPVASLYDSFLTWPETLHADDRARVMAARKAQAAGTYNMQYRILRPDGEIRWVQDRAFPVKNEAGEIYRLAGIVEDITERRVVQNELRASEKELAEAQRIARIGSWEADLISGDSVWSAEQMILLGIGVQERKFQFDDYLQRILHADRKNFEATAWQAVADGKSFEIEHRIVLPDGQIRWMQARAETIADASGKTVALRGTNQDITEQKENEQALKDSEVSYRRLFEAAKDGILILDAASGKIEDVNPYLEDLLGYSHTDFLGKQLWEIGAFKDILANKTNLTELQQKRYIRYEDLPLVTKNGAHIFVEFVSNSYEVNGRQIIQCNIRNITDRKIAADTIKDNEERFRQLAENISQIFYLINPTMTKIFYISPAYATMTGRTAESLYADAATWMLNIHPDDRERILLAVAPQGILIPSDVEFRIVDLTGHEHSVRSRSFPVYNAAGEVYRFAGLVEDVTKQRHVRTATTAIAENGGDWPTIGWHCA